MEIFYQLNKLYVTFQLQAYIIILLIIESLGPFLQKILS